MFRYHGKAFVSWSGGKESSLSCFRAMRNQDVRVKCLLNMVTEEGRRSRTHGLSAELLRLQAQAIGIPLVQRKAGWAGYEEEFKKALFEFKASGIRAGVFGDIDFREHRDWVERVCKEAEISPILPLWEESREKLLNDFIKVGFKAVVVATDARFLGREWLGRQIDKEFTEELSALGNVDLCGEKGEYHTFVYDGPIFKRPAVFAIGKKKLKGGRWFLELGMENGPS